MNAHWLHIIDDFDFVCQITQQFGVDSNDSKFAVVVDRQTHYSDTR